MEAENCKLQNSQSPAGVSPTYSEIEDIVLIDKGGRRVGAERRSFSYTYYIPERRSGMDRRSVADRRKNQRIAILPEIEGPQDVRPLDSRQR
jgi:hypothetical protein